MRYCRATHRRAVPRYHRLRSRHRAAMPTKDRATSDAALGRGSWGLMSNRASPARWNCRTCAAPNLARGQRVVAVVRQQEKIMQSDETRYIDVLMVDDEENHQLAFRRYIQPAADIRVVGEASNKSEAIELAYRLQPHVIIMDWKLGGGEHGLEATQEILKQNPNVRIIMMTQFENDDLIFQALKIGVRGYFVKWPAPHTIIDAIRTIYSDSNHATF